MDIGADNPNAKLPSNLTEQYSPSLPEDFPKERIPCNFCHFIFWII